MARKLSQIAERPDGTVDRRARTRFPIFGYVVRYKIRGKMAGIGKTIDMSAGGVLISTESDLMTNELVELAIDWPVQPHGSVPLKLMVFGRLVRVEGRRAAVMIDRYEFRTRRTGMAQDAMCTSPRRAKGAKA